MPKRKPKSKKKKKTVPTKNRKKSPQKKKSAPKIKKIITEEISKDSLEEVAESEVLEQELVDKENGKEIKEGTANNSEQTISFFKTPLSKDTGLFILIGLLVFTTVLLLVFLLHVVNPDTSQKDDFTQNIDSAISSDENTQEQEQEEEFAEAKKIDSSDWSTYTNNYYGFSIKYPPDWKKVTNPKVVRGTKWIQRYQFRKANTEENNSYLGFDVAVYDVNKIKELQDTEEFPALKEGADPNNEACQTIDGHLEENPNYPAEEIYIPASDDCYNSTLFYSITRDEYVYNIIPIRTEGSETPVGLRKQTLRDFPEFFESAVSFNLIDIVKPKPKPAAPKITAPMPVAAKKVNGKLVCAKKHDKPSYSKKTKHKHLDMECCLDPDEYPNPWCYYDPAKYGKYLK